MLMIDGWRTVSEQSRCPRSPDSASPGLPARSDTTSSVTSTNNASICCGVWPDRHGITGNSYLDERTGREEYMESAGLVMAPTLFQRAQMRGVKSALLSSKKKTTTLLSAGADTILTAEAPPDDWVKRLGPAPDIYSREINYWLMAAAIDLLKTRPDLQVPVHPHHGLPDACVAARGAESNAPGPAGPTTGRSGGRGSRCGIPADGRSRHEFQEPVLGSRKGLRPSGSAHPHRHFGGTGQVSKTPSRPWRRVLGLLQERARS
jgi:hypothetical protein